MEQILEYERVRNYIGEHIVYRAEYGVSADVWIVSDRVVIKTFAESYPRERLECEISILNKLADMRVPKVIDRFRYEDREIIIYEYLRGSVSTKPTLHHIEAIAQFLSSMHTRLSSIDICTSEKHYDINSFKNRALSEEIPFKSDIESLEFVSNDDTIIHGDLFPDNALFIDDELSGVIDFSDASIGDRYFDIAVVIFSWCADDIGKIDRFLEAYGEDIDKARLKEAINFALLYYIYQRYMGGRDWKSLYELRYKILSLFFLFLD